MNCYIKKIFSLLLIVLISGCVPMQATISPTVLPESTPELSQPSSTPPEITDENTLKAVLAAHLEADVNELTITIDQNTGTHARGGVDNGYYLAVKVNDQWLIVADGQGALDCQVIAQYDFPSSILPECSGPSGGASSDEDALKAAMANYLGVNVNDLTITINQNIGTHASGGAENGYFLAAKVNGQWMIVAAGQGVIDCQALAQYAFPASMLPDC